MTKCKNTKCTCFASKIRCTTCKCLQCENKSTLDDNTDSEIEEGEGINDNNVPDEELEIATTTTTSSKIYLLKPQILETVEKRYQHLEQLINKHQQTYTESLKDQQNTIELLRDENVQLKKQIQQMRSEMKQMTEVIENSK